MNAIIYCLGSILIFAIQSLPLALAAQIGRFGGALAYWIDKRHRLVALQNLAMCFPEKSETEITALAKESYRRLGENYVCAVKTAGMDIKDLLPRVEINGLEKLQPPRRIVVAAGHFGNFELYARFVDSEQGYTCAATYRALKQPALNRLMEKLRARSGCLFFERRTQGAALRMAMNQPAIVLGLMADQHGGKNGLRLPFMDHDCSTTPAPAIFALRYGCDLLTIVCFRTGLGRWRVEIGEKIPTHETDGKPRAVEAITRDVLRAQEKYIRRDPPNWFWVHRRWKPVENKAKSESKG